MTIKANTKIMKLRFGIYRVVSVFVFQSVHPRHWRSVCFSTGSWWIRVNQDDLNSRQRRKISRNLRKMIDREKKWDGQVALGTEEGHQGGD